MQKYDTVKMDSGLHNGLLAFAEANSSKGEVFALLLANKKDNTIYPVKFIYDENFIYKSKSRQVKENIDLILDELNRAKESNVEIVILLHTHSDDKGYIKISNPDKLSLFAWQKAYGDPLGLKLLCAIVTPSAVGFWDNSGLSTKRLKLMVDDVEIVPISFADFFRLKVEEIKLQVEREKAEGKTFRKKKKKN